VTPLGSFAMSNNQKHTLLLADELAMVREGIGHLCEATGLFRLVGQCGDGATALEMLQETRPDLAVIDIGLPKVYSLELIRHLKEHKLDTKFVVLAAKGDRKMALEALRCGASAFVLKSGGGDQLLEALHQVAQGSIYVSAEVQFERIFMTPRRGTPADPIESLSSREYQVFQLMVDGVRAKEIASRLNLPRQPHEEAGPPRRAGFGEVCDPAGPDIGSLSPCAPGTMVVSRGF
jgi:DNA-binding NarL/FixJ family response regulator